MSRIVTLFLTTGLLFSFHDLELCAQQPSPIVEPGIEVIEPELTMPVTLGHSKLVKTTKDVFRVSVTSPDIVTFTQYNAREFEVIGKSIGETSLTIWFGKPGSKDAELLRYLIKVEKKKQR